MTASFDSAKFRQVLGHVPTSVVVVTGISADGTPRGITIGSFVSVSLEPALVGFLPGLNSRSWADISASGRFCVNVLADGQDELCWRFAKEGDDKFEGVEWVPSATGLPQLPGVIATIDCTVHSETVVGDHFMVVGAVESLDNVDDAGDAMAFYRGKVTRAVAVR
jgi:flavin reductase (DIM6/NTAB) family NADH-FMN oxidoreductase RutF